MENEKLKVGETVYTILRHVSRSGMFRVIDAVVIRNGEPRNVRGCLTEEQRATFLKLYPLNRTRDGHNVGGCGMDMGFDLVYNLSRIVFKGGHKCIGENCPSNDHTNGMPRTPKFKGMHKDGGYALRQRWL